MTDNEDGEDLFDKTHFYHNEEKYGQILSASYDPRTQSVIIIAQYQKYTNCLQSDKDFRFKTEPSSYWE